MSEKTEEEVNEEELEAVREELANRPDNVLEGDIWKSTEQDLTIFVEYVDETQAFCTSSIHGKHIIAVQQILQWYTLEHRRAPKYVQFRYKHAESGELASVTMSIDDIQKHLEEELIIDCGCGPVGETNVVECNCSEYYDKFEYIGGDLK